MGQAVDERVLAEALARGIWDVDSQRRLPFEIWQPGPGYASVFPSNATGVAFLRADLNAPGAPLAASPAPAAATA